MRWARRFSQPKMDERNVVARRQFECQLTWCKLWHGKCILSQNNEIFRRVFTAMNAWSFDSGEKGKRHFLKTNMECNIDFPHMIQRCIKKAFSPHPIFIFFNILNLSILVSSKASLICLKLPYTPSSHECTCFFRSPGNVRSSCVLYSGCSAVPMAYHRQAIQWASSAKVIISRVRITMLY